MLSLTTVLFGTFAATHLYAVVYHFPRPRTGLVSTDRFTQLQLTTSIALTLAFWSIVLTRDNASMVLQPFRLVGIVSLFSGISLFAWQARYTRPGRFSVIFGRVTPQFVLTQGPFAYVRHPTYVSYGLGWTGIVLVSVAKSGIFNLATLGLAACVINLGWIYNTASKVEEKQFLDGQDVVHGREVDEKVKSEYRDYVRAVSFRFIPGVI